MDEMKMILGMIAVRDLAEESARMLALARAIMLKTGAKEEDVTEFLNMCGQHYGKMYDEMTLEQIMAMMTLDVMKGGK